jgi:hypothetical protein
MSEHAVIVHLPLSNSDFGAPQEQEALFALQDELATVIENTRSGEFDGDEFGEGECVVYTYGPDADVLFAAIEPVLKASSLARGGYAIKRYGEAADPAAREVRVTWI